jgi:hypothetical protein
LVSSNFSSEDSLIFLNISSKGLTLSLTSTLPNGNLGSVAFLLAATLYQGNTDRNHKLWNIVSSERDIRRVPLVEQELLTLLEHLSSPPVFSGVHVTRSLALYGLSLTVKRTVVGLLACSIKMSGSKPKLKVRPLDEMFKKISLSSVQ